MLTRIPRITLAILLLASAPGLIAQEVSEDFLKTYRAYDRAYKQGDLERATELAGQTLRIAEQELGGDHPKIPVLLINLGHVQLLGGDLEQARDSLTRAQEMITPDQDDARANLITIHQDLARIHVANEDLEAAREELDRAIELRTEESGEDDPRIAEILNMKAELDIAEQRFDSAEQLLNQGMGLIEERFGEDNPRVVGYLTTLGDLAMARGQNGTAEELLLRGLEILNANLLPDDPSVLGMHRKLANLYIAMDSDKFTGHADTYIANANLKEGSALPLFIVKPDMPESAGAGWVLLEMTVTENGRVEDPRVIESSPSGEMDSIVINAARKWRFKPKVQDGERLTQPNTRARIVFQGERVQVHLGEMG